MLVRNQHHFLVDLLYFCLSHWDRHTAMRSAVQTYIEELFAWFMIFQGNIEQKLRQHKSSVQRVHPHSLYNSCYYWTPFGARSLVTSVITQKAYFWKKLLQLQVQCFLFCFSMKILKKSVTYEFGVLAHHWYKSQ